MARSHLKDVKKKEKTVVPDGVYTGLWTAYSVEFETPLGTFVGASDVGVRGRDIPCVVRVLDGRFSVTAKDD